MHGTKQKIAHHGLEGSQVWKNLKLQVGTR